MREWNTGRAIAAFVVAIAMTMGGRPVVLAGAVPAPGPACDTATSTPLSHSAPHHGGAECCDSFLCQDPACAASCQGAVHAWAVQHLPGILVPRQRDAAFAPRLSYSSPPGATPYRPPRSG